MDAPFSTVRSALARERLGDSGIPAGRRRAPPGMRHERAFAASNATDNLAEQPLLPPCLKRGRGAVTHVGTVCERVHHLSDSSECTAADRKRSSFHIRSSRVLLFEGWCREVGLSVSRPLVACSRMVVSV